MKISIIAAFNPQFVIGVNGKIPWHIPEDLKRFKQLTMGKPIIMGRKTWESLGRKPLPGRMNVVVSASVFGGIDRLVYMQDHVVVSSPLNTVIHWAEQNNYDEVFIIGGERLYQEAIPLADKMYLTTVRKDIPEVSDSDEVAYFPIWVSTPSEWITVAKEVFGGYSFQELERIK